MHIMGSASSSKQTGGALSAEDPEAVVPPAASAADDGNNRDLPTHKEYFNFSSRVLASQILSGAHQG